MLHVLGTCCRHRRAAVGWGPYRCHSHDVLSLMLCPKNVCGCRQNNGGRQLPSNFSQNWTLPRSGGTPLPAGLALEAGASNWLMVPLTSDFHGTLHHCADPQHASSCQCINRKVPLHTV